MFKRRMLRQREAVEECGVVERWCVMEGGRGWGRVCGVVGMEDGVVGGVPQVCGGNGACNCAELVVGPSVLCGARREGGGR
jgi:hypothetical protein